MSIPSRIVAVDCGNTLLKMTFFVDGEPVNAVASEFDDLDSLTPLLDEWEAEGAVVCASGHSGERLMEMLHRHVGGPVHLVDRTTPMPIVIDYATPRTLGLDRIADALGAMRCYPGCGAVVADAGTALTLDVIDGDGTFRGGNISPGINMRLRAMHEHTAALPEVSLTGDIPAVGYDTLTAMRSGAVLGVASEIVMAYVSASRCSDCSMLVVTGGDAPLLLDIIRNMLASLGLEPKVAYAPLLVAYGLLSIYDYNEKD